MIEETELIVANFSTFTNVLTDIIWFYSTPVRRDILDDGQGFTLAEQADKCGFLHPVLYYYEKTDDLSKSITVCYVQCQMIYKSLTNSILGMTVPYSHHNAVKLLHVYNVIY